MSKVWDLFKPVWAKVVGIGLTALLAWWAGAKVEHARGQVEMDRLQREWTQIAETLANADSVRIVYLDAPADTVYVAMPPVVVSYTPPSPVAVEPDTVIHVWAYDDEAGWDEPTGEETTFVRDTLWLAWPGWGADDGPPGWIADSRSPGGAAPDTLQYGPSLRDFNEWERGHPAHIIDIMRALIGKKPAFP